MDKTKSERRVRQLQQKKEAKKKERTGLAWNTTTPKNSRNPSQTSLSTVQSSRNTSRKRMTSSASELTLRKQNTTKEKHLSSSKKSCQTDRKAT
jgi:hypothetical protein